ncbi:MAG: YIP1 family protein [Candidatus Methanospirare jalkutatii]|nr:YIP1 family protein [Candidatus Methanospirare jalkutatii]
MTGIVEKIKGFLFSPSETFDASKGDTLGDAFKYYIILLLIPALLSAVIAAVAFSLLAGFFGRMLPFMSASLAFAGVGAAVVVFLYVLIAGAIGVLIGGLWLHIWVYLVGGRKGLTQTFKALMYGATPSLLLGWIPVIGFLASIWALIVEIIGIRQLHEISTGKAVAAVILAIILPLIVLLVILLPAMMPITPHGHGIGGHYWHRFP